MGFVNHVAEAVCSCDLIAGLYQSGEDVPERLSHFIGVAQEANWRVSPEICFVRLLVTVHSY